MRIIILNQFFYPDHSATSQLMTDLAESLVERGVAVTALAGRGRYSGGAALPPREEYRGVKIERAWATNFGKRRVAGRLADYLSFYVGATWKLWLLPRHDLVMALTTPPLIGLIALLIGRLRGMRVVALVQDVYPDVAVALGALPARGRATRFFDALNHLTLRGADRVIVLGECMRERVAAKLAAGARAKDAASSDTPSPSPPIDVIHNWADGAQIVPLGDEPNTFSARENLDGKFVVLFSGNLGLVNEFSAVLEGARLLQERRPDVLFLFVGEGARRAEIEAFVKRHELSNVRLLPYQPREMLRFSLAAGHVSLVTLAPGLAGLSVPSKTYGILAAGRPILFVGDSRSDTARLVAENDCGAVVAADHPADLARVVEEWAKSPAELIALGRNARRLFEAKYERAHAVQAYLDSFAECLDGEKNVPYSKSRREKVGGVEESSL